MVPPFAQLIADWLTVQSQRHAFTVEKAAARLSVQRSTLYSWMTGEHFPPESKQPRLAKDLGVDLKTLQQSIAISPRRTKKPRSLTTGQPIGETP